MRISDWSSDVCSSDLLGKSGLAAARALHASGAEVWAWDDSEDQRAKAREAEIPLVDLNSVNWQEVTSLILSPGIPHSFPAPHPAVAEARKHGVEIIGDIELLARSQRNASYVGITGTRSEDRSGGKECVSRCNSWGARYR